MVVSIPALLMMTKNHMALVSLQVHMVVYMKVNGTTAHIMVSSGI
jgi:hypothetical protein